MIKMLIDFHTHSKGISRCCQIEGKDMVKVVLDNGMNGIILTNHYDKNYVENNDSLAFAKKYIAEYHSVKEYGALIGIKAFFGIELTMAKHNNVHMLIYGVSEEWLLEHSDIYDYTQKQLFDLVKEAGGILVQAHPFRNGKDVLLDLNLMNGVEVNCHPLYDETHLNKLSNMAHENNILLTCGGDFHADTHRPKCGVYLPDFLQTTKEIVDYLIDAKTINLCIQEVGSMTTIDYVFDKN